MSKELKPVRCGCGGEAVVGEVHFWGKCYTVQCSECGAETKPFDTASEAIEAWNRAMGERPPKGEWIDGLPYINSHWWVCSVCHVPAPENHTGYNFCPNCGTRMTRGER